jgi:putative transposase
MSTRDIENHVREMYGVEMSEASISHITDRIIEHVRQWKSRPLDKVYLVVWLDAIVFKVRSEGKVIDKAIQLAIGLNKEGKKEILGMWLCENESAAFWMGVLTDLQVRGVKDIIVTSTDNLRGFTEAIRSIFKNTKTQICIVHQLRNSLKYVIWRDKKQVATSLKNVYGASNEKTALEQLEEFDKQWSKKYPYIVQSWRNNWHNLSTFFEFPLLIRKLIYTTNTIESVNRNIRKYTKSKAVFPNDNAVEKVVYLALMKTQERWSQSVKDWPLIILQFINLFGHERCDIQF